MFTENWFEKTLKTGAVFLDLAAAYDTIWHTGLLYKLSSCLPLWCVQTVELLLRNHCFWVHMGDDVSSWQKQAVCHRALSQLQHCSTYTPMTFLLHVATGLSMPMTFAVPSNMLQIIEIQSPS